MAFGTLAAISVFVHLLIVSLDMLPEPGRLAIVGLGLIFGAILLRRILLPHHPALDSHSKADVTR